MHTARYYHALELKYGPGQGDIREGTIFPNTAVYCNTEMPIYCMYMIKDSDILKGHVIIDRKVVDAFGCQNGYMVIMPFEAIAKALTKLDTNNSGLVGYEVWYGIPTQRDIEKLFNSKEALNLAVKHPFFSYQKEYRLIVLKNYTMNELVANKNADSYTFSLKEPIRRVAKKISICALARNDTGYDIDVEGLFEQE